MAIDFSSVGGRPVASGPIDFSSVGGRPVDDPNTVIGALKRNVLSNAPLAKGDWSGALERAVPASVGAGIGGTLGSVAGPWGTAGGAYVGGTAGEGMRQLAVNLRNLSNDQEATPAAASLDAIQQAGQSQAEGTMLAGAVTSPAMQKNVYEPAWQMAKDKTAGMIEQFARIPRAMTDWAMARGPKEILQPEMADPAIQQAALEGMRSDMIGQKRAAGALVGTAEDQFAGKPIATALFDTSPVAAGVRVEMAAPAYRDAALPFGNAAAEKGALGDLAGKLESGPSAGLDLLGVKKNLAKSVDWNGSPIPDPSSNLQRVQKGVVSQLSGTLNNADPAGLGVANPNFGVADDLHAGYQKLLGDTPNPGINNDTNAINRLRLMMSKGGPAAEGLTNFDASVAASREGSLNVRDSLAASAPEAPPAPAVADRSPILAQKMQALKDAEAAVSAPAPSTPPTPPVAPVPTPTPGSASAVNGLQSQLPPPSPASIVPQPLTGGSEVAPMTPAAPPPPDPLMQAPPGYPRNMPEAPASQAPADYRTPAQQFLDARSVPPAPEPPLTPVQRLRAAQASVSAEQARSATPAPAASGPTHIPWQKAPEGPGWLDQPAGTPGRDMQDALTAAKFFEKSDKAGSQSSILLRLLAAIGPQAAARGFLKGAQSVGQAGSAMELPQMANAAMPAALARILAARRASGGQ